MAIHKPTLIRVLRSIHCSDLDYDAKAIVMQQILLDAIAHDVAVDMEKMLKGAGIPTK